MSALISPPIAPAALGLHFDNTLGAVFLGHFAVAVLFGITSLQTWQFFRNQSQDSQDTAMLKALVLLLWVLDCVHSALVTAAVYFYVVTNFGNIVVISKPHWTFSIVPVLTTIMTLIIRGIFAYRLWRLSSGGTVIPILIICGSLWIMATATYFSIELQFLDSWLDVRSVSWTLYSGFGCETVTDLVITVSQYLSFRRLSDGVVFTSTDAIIHTLMVYSINTCLVTSICGICCLVTFSALPDTLIFIAFFFLLSKLYLNALLANLNARRILRRSLDSHIHPPEDDTIAGNTISFFRPLASLRDRSLSLCSTYPATPSSSSATHVQKSAV
ncbi:hypothetical protein CERSUDRAFT_119794 [Gelatoporia subvermispora B]|uniref:DUF6534 domain-containing protein n=1 Tax=Ceriporiopsis subvermispora (strain B) TaxID=914234 RepID=M2QHA9_CERS8|nr:hypothetical protein CERSUDRAFT_119794 [Gelatoporia subvermispora B]